MTTEFDVRLTHDLFADNDVLCLLQDNRLGALDLAGVAWLTQGSPPGVAHGVAFDHVRRLAANKLTGYEVWLLACNSSGQPDSRLARHRKLWGALSAQGLTIPSGRELPEHLVTKPDGLRYFGALRLGPGSCGDAVGVLHAEPASHIVVMRDCDEAIVERLSSGGWERSAYGPSADVVAAVCSAGGLVLWPVGAFDDREAGVVALAQKRLIAELLG